MKLRLIILALCFYSTNAIAQKHKKKDAEKTDTTDQVKFIPPKIVKDEEVKEDLKIETEVPMPIDEKISIVEAPVSEYGYSGNYNKTTSPQKTIFDLAGKYYLVSEYSPNSTGYYSSYRYGIEDTAGKTILPTVFSEIKNIPLGVSIKLGQLYGLVDKDFKPLLPMEYSYLTPVNGTKWLIANGTGSYNSSATLIDSKGKQIVPGEFFSISELNMRNKISNDTSLYLTFQNKDNLKALFSCTKMKFITDFNIKEIHYTNNNDLIIRDASGSRLVTRNLIPISNETFDNIISTTKNVMIVSKNKKFGLITNTGKYVLPCTYDIITQAGPSDFGCFIAGKDKKFICIDYLGKNLLNDVYDTIAISSYQSNNLVVSKNKKMGVKDLLNHDILPLEFDTIYASGNYSYKYITRKGKVFALYSVNGNLLNGLDFDKIEPLSYNYKLFYKNNKIGLMTNEFTKITEPLYDKIERLTYDYGFSNSSQDYFKVAINNKYGVITRSGEVVPIIYDQVLKLTKVYIVKQNSKYGLIRISDQKMIAPCKYDYIGNDNSNDAKFIAIEGTTSTNISLN